MFVRLWDSDRFGSDQYPGYAYGRPYDVEAADQISKLGKRPFVIGSKSMSENGNLVSRLVDTLNSNPSLEVAGVRIGIGSHTPFSDVLETAAQVKKAGADSIVTIGGGSIIDGAKAVSFVLANDADTHDKLSTLFVKTMTRIRTLHTYDSGGEFVVAKLPIVCVTTTLSGGEYNAGAGVTDDRNKQKHLFYPGTRVGPRVIVLDPEVALTTPRRIWLCSGVRAVDHCVETILAVHGASDESRSYARRGLVNMVRGLLGCVEHPDDPKYRLECQLAGPDTMRMLFFDIFLGASHGIGHQLGPYGVDHGVTSSIMLPNVLKYNETVNADQQKAIVELLASHDDINQGLVRALGGEPLEGQSLPHVLQSFFKYLNLPTTLHQVDITSDNFDAIAQNSMHDICTTHNPRPLEVQDVIQILQLAA